MEDKSMEELSESSCPEYGSNNMHKIVKSFVRTKYVNIIGGSTTKGAPIKGGISGEK